MLDKKLSKTIAIIKEEIDALRPLKGDLVDKVVDLKVLLGDIEKDSEEYVGGVLYDCPIWYLKNELRALGARADKIHEAILRGVFKIKKSKPKLGTWNNRILDFS